MGLLIFKDILRTGLFERAEDRLKKDPKYRDYVEVIDEVCFFGC